MSEWKARRFWTQARVVETGDGFGVALDGRPVRTPAKAALTLPTRAMAEAAAAEWQAQEGEVRPASMPVTRAANAAIDKVARRPAEVAEAIASYADTDLLCYRADSPRTLVARQEAGWDPLLDWAADTFGARLVPVTGVMYTPQPEPALRRLAEPLDAMDAFALTALHDLVGLSGSLVIGLAAIRDAVPAERLWQLSRIDETWQAEQWGEDAEARAQAETKESEFLAAKRFHDLARRDA
jgi:chaperone required for assembly of F1-ATPase